MQEGYSSLSVCMSFTALTARVLNSAVQAWYGISTILQRFVFRGFCEKIIASSTGAPVYEVLFVFYSHPNDVTETATFDRAILLAMLCVHYLWLNDGSLWLSCGGKIQVIVDGWLKHTFSFSKLYILFNAR